MPNLQRRFMDRDTFKMIHSELIQQVQCIEHDLKIIYAAMKKGKYKTNLSSVENANLGKIARELEKLDYSDYFPELTEEDYAVIDDIRTIRNYWCHQCYLDYVYIQNDYEREKRFQEIAYKLHLDENKTFALHQKIEKMRIIIFEKYR